MERYGRRPYIKCLALAPADDTPAALLTTVGRALDNHPLAVCLYVEDVDAARQAAERIAQAGALLVLIGRTIEGVASYGVVEVGWPDGAELLGNALDAVAGARPNPNLPHVGPSYVLIHEEGQDETATLIYRRFTSAVRAKATMSLLAEQNATALKRSARELVEDALRTFPNARLIVTLNPEPWLSLAPRLRLPPQNRFATLSAAPLLWPRLRAGEAAALVGPLDGEVGFAAVEMAVQGLMRVPYAPTRVVIQCALVTRETLDDFARRYAEAADIADVAELMPFTDTGGADVPSAGGGR